MDESVSNANVSLIFISKTMLVLQLIGLHTLFILNIKDRGRTTSENILKLNTFVRQSLQYLSFQQLLFHILYEWVVKCFIVQTS